MTDDLEHRAENPVPSTVRDNGPRKRQSRHTDFLRRLHSRARKLPAKALLEPPGTRTHIADQDPRLAENPAIGAKRISFTERSPFVVGFALTLGGLAAWWLLTMLTQLGNALVIMVLSLFLALGLNPIVEFLNRRRIRRGVAVFLVALAVVIVLGLAMWAVIPVLTKQVNGLIQNAPAYLEGLRQNPTIGAWDAQYQIIGRINELLLSGTLLTNLFGGILGAGRAVANIFFSVITTMVLTVYFLASLPAIKDVIYELAPASRRPRVRYLADEMFSRVGGYMSGLFLVALCSSTVTFVYLNVAGLSSYSLTLAVVVAMVAFIPMVGPTSYSVIVTLVAFSVSPTKGLITMIFFLCYLQLDSYVIQPRIFARSVRVPGIVVIVAALCGGFLLGIIGALLAIPTAASLLLLYREVLVPHLDHS